MDTPWFYLSRKSQIESKIQSISNYSNDDIKETIESIYNDHFNESCVGINWDRFEKNELITMCLCIGSYGISMICNQLSMNYNYWSGGCPDLFLYKINKNNNKTQYSCKIIEVKGPRDKLSEKQSAWIAYLIEVAKLDAMIAYVKEYSGK